MVQYLVHLQLLKWVNPQKKRPHQLRHYRRMARHYNGAFTMEISGDNVFQTWSDRTTSVHTVRLRKRGSAVWYKYGVIIAIHATAVKSSTLQMSTHRKDRFFGFNSLGMFPYNKN
jgi:hypothetical protein